jgi:fluoride exporter
MTRFLLVCLGGAIGSGARYLVALATVSAAFPLGTLIVNVVGSFAIAMVMELVPGSDLRLFLATGILGGFTTYSAFNQETLTMMRNGAGGSAAANVLATLLGCLAAGFLGIVAARAFR